MGISQEGGGLSGGRNSRRMLENVGDMGRDSSVAQPLLQALVSQAIDGLHLVYGSGHESSRM